jgi:hypothetical protein
MSLLKSRSIRFYLGFVLILAMAIGGTAVAAFATNPPPTTTNASVAVNAGNLSESAPATAVATAVTLSGDDQTTTYSFDITVTDATGSNAGWNLQIAATQFNDLPSTDTLPSTASTISGAPTATCISNGNNCSTLTNTVTYPPILMLTTSAQKFFNAAAGSGRGKFKVTPTVNVFVPANTVAATYSSTVTVSLVSGP